MGLDVKGLSWSSENLAGAFREWELAGKSTITFVIGGDLGLSPLCPVPVRYLPLAVEDDFYPPDGPVPAA